MSNSPSIQSTTRPTLYPDKMREHLLERERNIQRATADDRGKPKHDNLDASELSDRFARPHARDVPQTLGKLGLRQTRQGDCVTRALVRRQGPDGAINSLFGATVCRGQGRLVLSAHLFRHQSPITSTAGASFSIGEGQLDARAGKLGYGVRGEVAVAQLGLHAGARPTTASASDERGSVTAGFGAGAGLLYRSEDSDGDGHRERGVSVDVGPVGVHAVSEDWKRTIFSSIRGEDAAQRLVERGIEKTLEAIGKR